MMSCETTGTCCGACDTGSYARDDTDDARRFDDVLDQTDTVLFSDYPDVEGVSTSQMQRAGIDETTDVHTFMTINGRNAFITEV